MTSYYDNPFVASKAAIAVLRTRTVGTVKMLAEKLKKQKLLSQRLNCTNRLIPPCAQCRNDNLIFFTLIELHKFSKIFELD